MSHPTASLPMVLEEEVYEACSSTWSRTERPSSGRSFCQVTHARSFANATPLATAVLAMVGASPTKR